MSQKFSNCFVFLFVLDQNAGTGQPAPRQHDVQLHQHLPDRGHQRAVESECCILLGQGVFDHKSYSKVWSS